MKYVKVIVVLLTLGLVGVVVRPAPAKASAQAAITVGPQQYALTSTATSDSNQVFSGEISQMDGKYVLEDTASKATYQLDDQQKAKQYDGKKVKVTGSLDAATNTIHVSDIQPA